MSTNKILEQMENKIADNPEGIKRTVPVSLYPYASVAAGAIETNGSALIVQETVDVIGCLNWVVPQDYSENDDVLKFRCYAGMVTVSTDDDVELDLEVYKKTAAAAIGSDLNPTAPGTVLAAIASGAVEHTFDLSNNTVTRGDIIIFKLITNGANDTNGEEVVICGCELEYNSTIVANNIADR